MKEEDIIALRSAVATLEHPGLAARLGEIAGKSVELLGRALPASASKVVAAATTKALNAALAVAFRTMQNEPQAASGLLHKALAATTGAVGGSFGLAALPIELPISTIIMLRSGSLRRAQARTALASDERQQHPGDACPSLSAAVVAAVTRNLRNAPRPVTRFVGSADQTRAGVRSAVSD